MRVLDLFSGIGGFSLGLERAGMRTVAFCECDPFCVQVLRKHWPDIPVHPDVRTLPRIGGVDVVCGGFPCQPWSHAGKQLGAEDDRHLWPAMFKVINRERPAWIVGENVVGLHNLGLDNVLSDLEDARYAWRAFDIPAGAVGANHKRHRLWIVARDRDRDRESAMPFDAEAQRLSVNLDDAYRPRLQKRPLQPGIPGEARRDDDGQDAAMGGWWDAEPDVGRVAHGVPPKLDGTLDEYAGALASAKGITKDDAVLRCLRAMRRYGELTEASSQLSGCGSIRDPLSEVSRRLALGREIAGETEELRNLWQAVSSEPLKEAQDVLKGMLEQIGARKRPKEMGTRVDRLRSLGNAVVPQVVEVIGRAIMRATVNVTAAQGDKHE